MPLRNMRYILFLNMWIVLVRLFRLDHDRTATQWSCLQEGNHYITSNCDVGWDMWHFALRVWYSISFGVQELFLVNWSLVAWYSRLKELFMEFPEPDPHVHKSFNIKSNLQYFPQIRLKIVLGAESSFGQVWKCPYLSPMWSSPYFISFVLPSLTYLVFCF